MAEFYPAIAADELKSEEMTRVVIAGKEILIARQGEKFYAADNRCPHMGGNLSKGKLEGHVVTCPVHESQFDLSNGSVVRWTHFTGIALAVGKVIRKPRPVVTYPVKVEAGQVRVSL
jgi:3-phenylpropionate/trans-cinnamate dioxygenase ferredoxin component